MTRRRIIVIDAKGAVHGHSVDLPAMQPGDSVRVTMTADGGFDVVRLMRIGAYTSPTNPNRQQPMWTDAAEQENDRG